MFEIGLGVWQCVARVVQFGSIWFLVSHFVSSCLVRLVKVEAFSMVSDDSVGLVALCGLVLCGNDAVDQFTVDDVFVRCFFFLVAGRFPAPGARIRPGQQQKEERTNM